MNFDHLTSGRTLVHARIALHHAAQVASAFGASWIEPDAKHVHASFRWDSYHRAMVGERSGPWQVGLRPADMTWILLATGNLHDELPAVGHTMAQGIAWVAKVTEKGLGKKQLLPVGYTLPTHPAAVGAPFAQPDEEDLITLSAWFDAAYWVVKHTIESKGQAADIRVWPEHLALSAHISRGTDSAQPRSIEIGMSPGCTRLPHPYFYAKPHPSPACAHTDALPWGRWDPHAAHGAWLGATDLQGQDPVKVIPAFLNSAIDAIAASS